MDRRHFIGTGALASAGLALGGINLASSCASPKTGVEAGGVLNLSFGEKTAPGESLEERLDWMEAHGVVGLEPGGKGLGGRINEFDQALRGRNVKISAICAGFDGFILSEDESVRSTFDSSMREIIEAAGALGSVGVIMVPAFNSQKPCMPHTFETRSYLVERLHELGEYALSCGTTVILEPLNRREAFYLRLVGDAAAICRDSSSAGVKCMGDFWHMQEETSDYAAFMAAGKDYLQHVHIASRGTRNMPGEDGVCDNYVDGFRALKELDYKGFITFECGCKGNRESSVAAALELLRQQWSEAV